jgi:hypothetical protein
VTQDELGTHLDWELEGVTAVMIDWFWSNLEKGSCSGTRKSTSRSPGPCP